MEKEDRITSDMPTTEQIETELRREVYRRDYSRVLMSTIGGLVTVAAAAVLIAVLLLPVLQIFGRSMSPTLREGDIVLSLKTGDFRTGDVVAFYYNNKILVKRVIAGPGDWVDLDVAGNVYVNGRLLATKQDDYGTALHFDVTASGTYMIKIGNYPARKVVVIR